MNWLIQFLSSLPWVAALLPAASLPEGLKLELVVSRAIKDRKVSAIHPLDNGAFALHTYDNDSRNDSWITIFDKNGAALKELHVAGAETTGTGDRVGDWIYVPAEDAGGRIIRINFKTYAIEQLARQQPAEYAARQVGGKSAYIPRGGNANKIYDMTSGEDTGKTLDLAGIVSGMVGDGRDSWIGSADGVGIASTKGWRIACSCPDVASVDGVTLAFLRNGDVCPVAEKKLGKRLGTTGAKPRRAVVVGGRIAYLITAFPTTVWAVSKSKMKPLHDFKNEVKNPDTVGSLFGESLCPDEKEDRLLIARTIGTAGGYEVYRATLK